VVYLLSLFLEKINVHTIQKVLLYKVSIVTSLVSVSLFSFYWLMPAVSINLIPEVVATLKDETIIGDVPTVVSFNWAQFLVNVYLIVVGAQLVRILVCYGLLMKNLWQSEEGAVHSFPVRFTKNAGPFCFGLFKPEVYLPKEIMNKLTEAELLACITHEDHHCQRRDPLWKMCSMILRAFLFFSPISYLVHRKFDLEMEKYCDYMTLKKSEISLREYGNLLIELSTFSTTKQSNFALATTGATIKRRVIEMTSRKKMQRPLLGVLVSLVFITLGLTTVVASVGKRTMYEVTGQAFVKGEQTNTFKVRLLKNKSAEMKMKHGDSDLIAKIMASEMKLQGMEEKGILIDMDLKSHNKKKTFHAQPKIVVLSGKTAVFELSDDQKNELLKLKLKAVRIRE
jgi:hypothetical protein